MGQDSKKISLKNTKNHLVLSVEKRKDSYQDSINYNRNSRVGYQLRNFSSKRVFESIDSDNDILLYDLPASSFTIRNTERYFTVETTSPSQSRVESIDAIRCTDN